MASVPSWRGALLRLQRLDVLTATEERALQQCEAKLFKLGEEAVENRLIADRQLASLAASAESVPTSLPAPLRPHLTQIIRAVVQLRENPSTLAWLLALRSAPAAPEEDERAARAVVALFDGLSPGDEARQSRLVVALCQVELRMVECGTRSAGGVGALLPGSLTARIVAGCLCRQPAARRHLQRALRPPLEAWLDGGDGAPAALYLAIQQVLLPTHKLAACFFPPTS